MQTLYPEQNREFTISLKIFKKSLGEVSDVMECKFFSLSYVTSICLHWSILKRKDFMEGEKKISLVSISNPRHISIIIKKGKTLEVTQNSLVLLINEFPKSCKEHP